MQRVTELKKINVLAEYNNVKLEEEIEKLRK